MAAVTRLFDLLELYDHEFNHLQEALNIKRSGKWQHCSASDYVEKCRLFSLGMLAMGIRPGDKIATVLQNSPEWNIIDMGLMQIGAIQVPIYPTSGPGSFNFIIRDSEVKFLFIYNTDIYRRVKKTLNENHSIKEVFSIEKVRGLRSWNDILEIGSNKGKPEELNAIKESIQPDDLATIIYTSGTTGRPKGVMLSHRNFISNFTGCSEIYDFNIGDRVLSFLPLCHVYERMLNYMFQYLGLQIFYVENFDHLAEYLKEVKPHTFAAVPRVLEKIYNRIVAKGRSFKGMRKRVFFWALRQGHKYEFGQRKNLFFFTRLIIADLLLYRHWRKILGGNVKVIVSGGASLHPRLARIFWAARIPLLEGYGLTETAPVIAVSRFDNKGVKFGTVGPVLPGVQVKFADDGEILVKGPNVMLGYYNRPDKTAEVFDAEGWFHTGDIGVIEDDRFLKITDRKKEIFKTSGGKYIAPQVIEQRFRESPFIEQMMVIGENKPYPTALILPNFEFLKNWCEVKHIPFVDRDKVIQNPRIIRRIKKEVEWYNQDLGQTEKIKKFRLLAEEWSMDSGELSPTLKLRRKYIQDKYRRIIEETYKSPDYDYRVEGANAGS